MRMLPIKLNDQEYEQLKLASIRLNQPMAHIVRRHLRTVIAPLKRAKGKTKASNSNIVSFVRDNAVELNTPMTSDRLDDYLYGRKS